MSLASAVGGFDLPAPAGALNASIDDLPVVAMLDYLGFWLRDQLNPAIAQVQGVAPDICPVGNRLLFRARAGSGTTSQRSTVVGGDAITMRTHCLDARHRTLTVSGFTKSSTADGREQRHQGSTLATVIRRS
jgi:hypothetical protein